MNDLLASGFLAPGWGWYVAILTVLSLLACLWILRANSTKKAEDRKSVV